jgi:hypothetical protein
MTTKETTNRRESTRTGTNPETENGLVSNRANSCRFVLATSSKIKRKGKEYAPEEQAIAQLRCKGPLSPKLGDGTAVLGDAAAVPSVTSVASLLERRVLRDGELILLILKPSRWYILLSSLLFAGCVAIIACALHLSFMSQTSQSPSRYFIDAGLFVVSCRIMWAILNWMGRIYVLTDQRILRISGVFSIEIFDCPLRKLARARVVRPFGERLLRLGTIEFYPSDETRTGAAWQTVNRPTEVLEHIEAAVRKAKQGL